MAATNDAKNKKMSPSEAGALGGSAHHEKRGNHGSDNNTK